MTDLLFELSCEELPASYLDRVCDALPEKVAAKLADLRVIPEGKTATVRVTGTPRRIVVHVPSLLDEQRALSEEVMGPPVSAAFKDGKPTKAAEAFAAKVGLPVDKVEQRDTPKGKYLVGTKKAESKRLLELLPKVLEDWIGAIEFPKSMTWVPGSKLRFARPLRGIVALFGGEVVPLEWNGVKSGRTTQGHVFLAPGAIEVKNASWPDYERALRDRKVIVSREERRETVQKLVQQHLPAGKQPNAKVAATAANLVEWPEVMVGEFEKKFLEIPPGVIVAAIQGHLRAFPLVDEKGALTNRFAFVANRPGNPTIRAGNERVLRARLSDAHFFFTKDQQTKLEELAPRLKDVMLPQNLGSYADKQERVHQLALDLNQSAWTNEPVFHQTAKSIGETAKIMKADLVTEVVGEFPELEGEVGAVYARKQGHPDEVAQAIREAYLPRNEGDELPRTRTGIALAIGEKLDNAVSAFATGMKPTGSKDPLGVRRAILGVLRILREHALHVHLDWFIERAVNLLPDAAVGPRKKPDPKAPKPDLVKIREGVAREVSEYVRARLQATATDEGYKVELVKAVLATGVDDVPDFWARVKALAELAASERFPVLAALVERTRNITKDAKDAATPRAELAKEPAEKDLFAAYDSARAKIEAALSAHQYVEAGRLYEQAFAAPVERFMKDVFVQDKDEAIRTNRISLLRAVYSLLAASFADLAEAAAGARPGG